MELDRFRVVEKGNLRSPLLVATDFDTNDVYEYVRGVKPKNKNRIEIKGGRVFGPSFDWNEYYRSRSGGNNACQFIVRDGLGLWRLLLREHVE